MVESRKLVKLEENRGIIIILCHCIVTFESILMTLD